ncbi:hypothetical protein B0H13DRAFT_2282007 [Mycena leptocephala]|nr:hypothetical protein B0H13DRAFT_2282007 [Mycena leptocephala]
MSNSSSPCMGIEPNPDISGIGVRVAIYAQALLSILYPIFFVWDGEISSKESKTMSRISMNITLTACALLVSAGIQAATFGLGLYHALIILQLSWINSMTFMTVHFVARAAQSIKPSERHRPPRDSQALVSSMHFIVVGGIGIWVWRHIQTFGDQAECNQDTFLVILSKTVYVAHGPVIRRVSLALYGISLVPLGNIYVMGGILGVVAAFGRLVIFCLLIIPELPAADPFSYTYFHVALLPTTRRGPMSNMIHRSSRLVQPGEGDWTFGQTLTLLLLFLPIWDAVEAIRGKDDEEC